MNRIKYCALTTISNSLKAFVLPSLYNLKSNGYDVTVSCAADEQFAQMVKDDFNYYPLDISRGFNLPKTLKNIVVLSRYFRKEKFQMIEYGTENIALCAAIAGFVAGVPVRIYNHWGARYVGLSGIGRVLSIWIERIAALFSTDVRQVSHRNAEMCVKQHIYPARKVKVLGKGGTIGVDFGTFDVEKKKIYREEILKQYGLNQNVFIFGYVGRIQTDKGINELISAFKKICEVEKNVFLMLVGPIDTENPISEENMSWIRSSQNVILSGFVIDTYRYISAFDVLVHPTYREGFGMVLQEAAAVKTPIITTDIMGPGEFIQNEITGILVTPRKVSELYGAMIRMYRNEELRYLFSESCYEYTINNFKRSVMLEKILKDREELKKRL